MSEVRLTPEQEAELQAGRSVVLEDNVVHKGQKGMLIAHPDLMRPAGSVEGSDET